MSANQPPSSTNLAKWYAGYATCSVCCRLFESKEGPGDQQLLCCPVCNKLTYDSLKVFVKGGVTDVGHILQFKTTIRRMFYYDIINLFATHLENPPDADSMREFFTKNVLGAKAESFDHFRRVVLEKYQEMNRKRFDENLGMKEPINVPGGVQPEGQGGKSRGGRQRGARRPDVHHDATAAAPKPVIPSGTLTPVEPDRKIHGSPAPVPEIEDAAQRLEGSRLALAEVRAESPETINDLLDEAAVDEAVEVASEERAAIIEESREAEQALGDTK